MKKLFFSKASHSRNPVNYVNAFRLLCTMDLETDVDSEAIALPKGCQHYADLREMAWDIQKSVLRNFAISAIASLIIWKDITINALAFSRNTTRVCG